MTFRDYMKERKGDNLSWCKPYKHGKANISIAVNEGQIVGIRIDGKDVDVTPESTKELIERLEIDANQYDGWDDIYILLEDGWEEVGCAECPWFEKCDAMED